MKRKKMTIKERIQWYKDQRITEIAPLFHDPIIGELSPDEVNKYHDELCELSGNKTITNPKVIEAIEAAERGECRIFELPNPASRKTFEFELLFKLPKGVSNDDALGIISKSSCEVTIGIGKEGELAMMFNEVAVTLEEAINSASNLISEIIPGAELKL